MSGRVFDFDRALVRTPAPSVVDGLRSGAEAPSYEGVLDEHRAYVAALEAAGLMVETLPPLDAFPDSLFVEDPAFVVPEGAILLKPGASSRTEEAAAIAPALRSRFERVLELDEGHADGGDILVLPDEIVIGLSTRTDRRGAERFVALAAALGRRARIVATPAGPLHFKTGCALIDAETVIAFPSFAPVFAGLEMIATLEGEEAGANLLRINDRVLVSADCPRTCELLAKRDHKLVPLPTAEINRIDAGLSCMSLRWKAS